MLQEEVVESLFLPQKTNGSYMCYLMHWISYTFKIVRRLSNCATRGGNAIIQFSHIFSLSRTNEKIFREKNRSHLSQS